MIDLMLEEATKRYEKEMHDYPFEIDVIGICLGIGTMIICVIGVAVGLLAIAGG